MHDDAEILRRYAETGAEEAFAEIVRRHLNLTWAAARRITGDADTARDVAQTVFADLARKARHLPRGTILAGWLYRAACLAAQKFNRGNRRREERERQAMNDASLQNVPAATPTGVEHLLPQLDEALSALGAADRDAVVLRFLSGKSLAEVGATLGVNEDAARKRVNRAVEKLRTWFGQRGMATSSTALLAALGIAASQVAPAGMASAVAATSLAGAGAAIGLIETLTLMKTKIALSAVAFAAVATPLTYQQLTLSRLRDENRALQAQVATATQPPAGDAKSAADAAELERLRAEHLELLRLRGEVGRLRADATRAAQLEKELQRLRAGRLNVPAGEATAAAQPSPEELEAAKAVGIMKLNSLKNWGVAMIVYASDNNDQLPPSLAAARKYFEDRGEQPSIGEDALEITLQGKISTIAEPMKTILARERNAWVDVRGRLAKTYVFADGHAEIYAPPNGEFAEWERARGVANP